MRKNILFIGFFMLITLFSFSQSLVLIDSVAGTLENNATIYKSGVNTEEGEIVQYLAVQNVSASDIPVMVKKAYVNIVEGSMNLFCWGICVSFDTFEAPEPITIQAGTTNWLEFSAHYLPMSMSGYSTVRYTFFAQRDHNDSVCVNVVYMAYPLGKEEMLQETALLSNAYPNPAKDKVYFNYTLPASTEGTLIVRNVLGSKIREVSVSAGSGKQSLMVSDLPEGVYFCTLEMKGKATLTRKMVISH